MLNPPAADKRLLAFGEFNVHLCNSRLPPVLSLPKGCAVLLSFPLTV
jgi:hypothetical protein